MSRYFSFPGSVTVQGAIAQYANFAAFPISAVDGTVAEALDTNILYAFNANSANWVKVADPASAGITVGSFDGQPANSNGAAIALDHIYMQSADATNPGLVNNTTQTFSGNKTFTGSLNLSSQPITNVADPTNPQDAATKNYVDSNTSNAVIIARRWVSHRGGSDVTGNGSPDKPFKTLKKAQNDLLSNEGAGNIYFTGGFYVEDPDFQFQANISFFGPPDQFTAIVHSDNSDFVMQQAPNSGMVDSSFTVNDVAIFANLTVQRVDNPTLLAITMTISNVDSIGNTITVDTGLALPTTGNGLPIADITAGNNLFSGSQFPIFTYDTYDSGTGIMTNIQFPYGADFTQFTAGDSCQVSGYTVIVNCHNFTCSNLSWTGLGNVGAFFPGADSIAFDGCNFASVQLLGVSAFVSGFTNCSTFDITVDTQGLGTQESFTQLALTKTPHTSITLSNHAFIGAVQSPFIGGPVTFNGTHCGYGADEISAWDVNSLTLNGGATAAQEQFNSTPNFMGAITNPAQWAGTPPQTLQQALDRITALLVTLNSSNPIP